ncbi:MAG: hypothetical protein ACYDCJ_10225 [Gammaproteobacteria bacterium]
MKAHDIKVALIPVIIALLALAGCMSVDIFSQRNPQWHGQPLKRVMVIGNFEDLVYRHYAEGQMCEYIADYSDTKCLESLNYLFAGQNEGAQIAALLNREKVEGVIYISTQARGVTIVNKPMVFSTLQWSPGFSTAIGYGGPTAVDWANYSVELFVTNGTMIWYANADASGNPEPTIEHSSYHISKELVKAGIIAPGGSRHYKPSGNK